MKPDEAWEWTQDDENRFIVGQVSLLKSKAQSEIDDHEHKVEWGDDADDIGMGKSRDLTETIRTHSPFEWLAGAYLPEAFRKCFGIEPTRTRDTYDGKDLSGPYLQFAEQVLIEFGITKHGRPYSRETISKALSDLKNGRVRRRRR